MLHRKRNSNTGLSRFKHAYRSRRCCDDTVTFAVTSSNGEVVYKFVSYNIRTFWLFALNGFNFIFFLANRQVVDDKGIFYRYVGRIFKTYRLSDDATIKARVCILNPCAVCILYLVCILIPICNPQSAFYTDRIVEITEGKIMLSLAQLFTRDLSL